ncbi:rhomboid family intramembrane serine protease [Rubrivirga sp. IMCC43871]|uniref:rhomboid family intramembrane serine protease n=1 Tax=Rubrivirga sp. IMCC43871 TaxID=3391575 RepID=UPI003990189C
MSADSPAFRFQIWRAALPPALRLLLTVNAVSYLAVIVLGLLAAFGVPGLALLDWLTLSPLPEVALVRPWTVLTYGFVNAFPSFFGLISFAFGMYWLNWMGRDFEETYGSGGLLAVYLFGVLGGALLAIVLGLILPTAPLRAYFGLWTPVTAVLCAVGTLQPNRGVGLFLLGVVPMKWIAIGFVVLSFAFSQDLTVLGAALAGYGFAKAQIAGRNPGGWASGLFGGGRRQRSAPTPSRNPFARTPPATLRTVGKPGRAERKSSGATLSVDAILDKILEKGYDSLTAEERDALDRASRD